MDFTKLEKSRPMRICILMFEIKLGVIMSTCSDEDYLPQRYPKGNQENSLADECDAPVGV